MLLARTSAAAAPRVPSCGGLAPRNRLTAPCSRTTTSFARSPASRRLFSAAAGRARTAPSAMRPTTLVILDDSDGEPGDGRIWLSRLPPIPTTTNSPRACCGCGFCSRIESEQRFKHRATPCKLSQHGNAAGEMPAPRVLRARHAPSGARGTRVGRSDSILVLNEQRARIYNEGPGRGQPAGGGHPGDTGGHRGGIPPTLQGLARERRQQRAEPLPFGVGALGNAPQPRTGNGAAPHPLAYRRACFRILVLDAPRLTALPFRRLGPCFLSAMKLASFYAVELR